ncbi:hypothetical protein KAU09_02175 [Candidatus Parcubacteria bacterium]|nr:hypothetical protein [Candidatus Parcubacteria bacterium]
MKYFFKFKIFLLSLILLSALCFFGSEKQVMAGIPGDNVSGWAWNSNVGWISFNSDDCNNDGSNYDGTPAGCPAAGTLFFDYGVNIDIGTGDFSGYAWNNNVGWISFNRCGTDGNCATADGDTGDPLPLADDPGGGNGPIAKFVSGDILGWAKILSMGNDGWIRFDHGQAGFEATGDVATNELDGFAWNRNGDGTGIGWISFSCEDYSSCLTGSDKGKVCTVNANCVNNDCGDTCSISPYQTKAELNQMPTADDLKAPYWTPAQACDTALAAYLKWKYNDGDDPVPGDKMSAYRLIVKNETDNVEVLDTGKCIKRFDGDNSCCDAGDADCLDNPQDCQIDVLLGFGTGDTLSYKLDSSVLTYGKAYSWNVEVWDSKNGSSGATPYDSITDMPINPLIEDGDPLTFTTYKSEFPNPDNFIWTPKEFSAGEEVLFESMDMAKYYINDVENNCDEAHCSWSWKEKNDNLDVTFDPSNASSTIIIFEEYNVSRKIELTVTDIINSYSCSSTTDDFTAKHKLPSWIETK